MEITILTIIVAIMGYKWLQQRNDHAGYVYVLEEPVSKELKIGHTKGSVEVRAKSIATTLKVQRIDIIKIWRTNDRFHLEKKLHNKYADYRLPSKNDGNGGSEWFSGVIKRDILE